jgi:hypothetical protein
MRLQELFLVETTEEDRAIISLASVIYRHVIKYADYIDPESTKPLDVGKIGDFADTPLDGFEDIKIELQQGVALGKRWAESSNKEYDGKEPRGVWFNEIPAIAFNTDSLYSEKIKSTIVHELRHALDDLKSEGKAGSSTRYRTPKKKEHRKTEPYLADPSEINGRFSQVLNALVDSISRNSELPKDQLFDKSISVLKRLFVMYDISSLFPEKYQSRDYKRLVKRAVDLINKEIAHIKSS